MSHCPHCGGVLEKAKAKPRSLEQHRRYFGLIRAAYHHWPETSDRQFSSEDELRAYVQIKAGYREVGAQIPLSGLNKERALLLVEAAIRGSGSYAIPIFYKDAIVVFKPKSIKFENMTHHEFCGLNDAVSTVIEQEIGIPADDLLRQMEEPAKANRTTLACSLVRMKRPRSHSALCAPHGPPSGNTAND